MGRAVAKVMKEDIKEACGPQQFAMHSDGAAHVHRLLQAMVAIHPGVAVASVDVSEAFPSIHRDSVLASIQKHCPDLYGLVYHMLKDSSTHTVAGEGGEASMQQEQHNGVDSGKNNAVAMLQK